MVPLKILILLIELNCYDTGVEMNGPPHHRRTGPVRSGLSVRPPGENGGLLWRFANGRDGAQVMPQEYVWVEKEMCLPAVEAEMKGVVKMVNNSGSFGNLDPKMWETIREIVQNGHDAEIRQRYDGTYDVFELVKRHRKPPQEKA